MSNPFDFFDKIYCINLDHRADRWDAVQLEFDKLGISDRVERVSAVNREDVKQKHGDLVSHLSNAKLGQLAVSLSSRKCIDDAIKCGARNCLTFQDDVCFRDYDEDFFREALSELPDDWECLFLGYECWKRRQLKQVHSERLLRIEKFWMAHAIANNGISFNKFYHDCANRIVNPPPGDISGRSHEGLLWDYNNFGIRNDKKFAFQVDNEGDSDIGDGKTKDLERIRKIHFSWKTKDIPTQFKDWFDSWKVHNPTWEVKVWTDNDNRNFIKEHYSDFLETYDNYSSNIERADAMRYFYLYHFGGLYVDLDFECLGGIEWTLSSDIVLGHVKRRRYKRNPVQEVHPAFMYCGKTKHDFFGEIVNGGLQKAFEESKNIDRNKRGFGCIEVWTTGVEFLRQLVVDGIGRYDIKMLSTEIYPYNDREKNQMADVEDFGERFPNSFAVHHWASSYRN